MIRYFSIWMVASLIMPVLVATVGRHLNEIFILTFWPGAIALISLGAERKPTIDVVYVWSVAVALNLALYFLVSVIFLILYKITLKNGISNIKTKS